MTRRPRRQKKADTLLHPGASEAAIRCDFATGPFDEEARRMDETWGVDRLPQLVPQDVADKYARALAALNKAIRDEDPERTAWAAQNCVKGMRKMHEIAEKAGHEKATGDIVEYEHEGWKFGILKDERQWPQAVKKYPHLDIVTLREVAVALDWHKHALVREAKKQFPQSEVVAIREPLGNDFYKEGGDEIPF